MINFRQLEVLKTLLATGSTIATAKSMGLSQSGVSRLLQQLETDLDLRLFDRTKAGLFPRLRLAFWRAMPKPSCLVKQIFGTAEDLRSGAKGPELVRVGLPSSMWKISRPP